MILDADAPGAIPLVADGSAATVRVATDAADVVDVAASDFADDLERVTGVRPPVADVSEPSDGGTGLDVVVLAGTAGESELVDACLDRSGAETEEFDDGTPFRECRESFVVATVADPPDALDAAECVLVAGSDRRGTAYGLYELSKRAGVSPWYWWADVPVDERESIAVAEGTYTFGPPSVTHRGIFLNDEDFGLRPWASETHAPEDADDRAGIGPTTYERIFELLLRLKANTVWPAMHPGTKAFYRYPQHAELADRYAVVVGTSHCEPMHRNNVDEWDEDERGAWNHATNADAWDEDERGAWNYATNADAIREYWRERVESVSEYENQFTIGMRGIHDSGMPGAETERERVALLQEVIDDQREMLADAHDRPADDVPQILCPYKEVLPLLRGGLDVPEDVCLVWPDDSHGYVRELPSAAEREREGGSGVYYHLSYWGRPHDFLWLSSVPLALVRHQLRTAYAAGARDCWVANVGDIKPTEKEMEFFLDLAWDVEGSANDPTDQWVEDWARREFGAAFEDITSSEDGSEGEAAGNGSRFLAVGGDGSGETTADEFASAVADVLAEYYRLCQARKPEHMGWSTVYPDTEPDEPAYSAVHGGDEARRRLEAFGALADRASDLWRRLPESHQAAFYQLVVHPVRCAALMTEKYLSAARSRLYAGQGRVTADAYAERALGAHDRIGSETDFYNETMLDGKWDGMMSASPRELPVFDEPSTASVDPHDGAALGVAVEGRHRPVGPHEETPPALPTFDPATDRTGFVDVFARGTEPVDWTAEPGENWITVSATEGTVSDERRLSVGVDWDALPAAVGPDGSGNSDIDPPVTGELTVSGAGVTKSVEVRADPTVDGTGADFVETNGHVAMEAESYSERAAASDQHWEATDLPGRVSGAAMAVRPPVFESVEATADAPRLSYDVALESAGEVTVELHCLPTQSVSVDHDLRCAVAVGDGDPSVVSLDVDGGEHNPEWQRNVLRGAAVAETTATVAEAGPVTLSVWALDPGVVLDRIVVRTDRDPERSTYLGPRETRPEG